MWQYYVLMALCVLTVVTGIYSRDRIRTSTYITPTQAIITVVIGSLMTWLIWSFLSVNWMWLSIGLMAVSFLNLSRLILQALVVRRTIPDNGSGIIMAIAFGVAYTVFYLKYVS